MMYLVGSVTGSLVGLYLVGSVTEVILIVLYLISSVT